MTGAQATPVPQPSPDSVGTEARPWQRPDGPLSPASIRLSRGPTGGLRLTVADDRSYLRVKVLRASPLTYPSEYFSLVDDRGAEICLVKDLEELDPESRRLAPEEVQRTYVVAEIRQVRSVRSEMGQSYWEVETDHGPRDFALKAPRRTCSTWAAAESASPASTATTTRSPTSASSTSAAGCW